MFIFNISLGIAAGFSHVFSFGVLADFARNAAENSSGISQAISSGISPRIARIQHCAMIFFSGIAPRILPAFLSGIQTVISIRISPMFFLGITPGVYPEISLRMP